MQDTYKEFHVGVNVLAARDGHLLLGKRKNIFGAGTWGLPGGHLETGEGMKEAAARELMEETGMRASSFVFSNIVNDRSGSQHYMQVGFVAHDIEGSPALREPDRCEEWRWFALDGLPADLFPPHIKQIENFFKNYSFVDA